MQRLRIKKVIYGGRNSINLCKRTYTHKADAKSENGKYLCQPRPLFSHSPFNIIERPAQRMSRFIQHTVLNCQYALGKFSGHSEKRRYDHPKKRSRPSRANSGCNANYISRSDSCGKSRTKRAETADFALAVVFVDKHVFKRPRQVEHLQKPKPCRKHNADSQYKYDKRQAPNLSVNNNYCLINFFKHTFNPSPIKIK